MRDPLLILALAALAGLLVVLVRRALAHVEIERTTQYWVRTIREATAVGTALPVATPASEEALRRAREIRGRGVGPGRR